MNISYLVATLLLFAGSCVGEYTSPVSVSVPSSAAVPTEATSIEDELIDLNWYNAVKEF